MNISIIFLAAAALTANTEQRIDLTQTFQDQWVELEDGMDTAAVFVADEGQDPKVTWADGGLCNNVIVQSIEHLGDGTVKIVTIPEFELDDGLNVCDVTVEQPSGARAVLKMFIDLD